MTDFTFLNPNQPNSLPDNASLTLASLIVPAFNAASTIVRCLDSLLSQTYKNIEIIVIDDGSTDATPLLVSKLATKDERIVFIRQTNQGVSAARNTGLKKAKGTIIGFVDSDDYVYPNYIDSLLRSMRDHVAEVATCGYTSRPLPFDLALGEEYRSSCFFSREDRDEIKKLNPSFFSVVWGKLFRSNLLEQISFDSSLSYGEDRAFLRELFDARSIRIAYCCAPFYFYDRTINALSSNPQNLLRGLSYEYKYLGTLQGKRRNGFLRDVFESGWAAFRELRTSELKAPDGSRRTFSSFIFRNFLQLGISNQIKGLLFLLRLEGVGIRKKSITKLVVGNMGNQLFQYAFLYAFSKENNIKHINLIFIDKFKDNLKDLNVTYSLLNDVKQARVGLIRRVYFHCALASIKKQTFSTDKAMDEYVHFLSRRYTKFGILLSHREWIAYGKSKPPYLCYGYFEDKRYFDAYRDDLKILFTPKLPPPSKNHGLYHSILTLESVCISVRRGDFLNQNLTKYLVCDRAYFCQAIKEIKKRVKNPCFVIFSDDILWCIKNLSCLFDIDDKLLFEDGTDEPFEKLRLMYSCKHFVLSNSTFSWWAQYLSSNAEKVVVAPKSWRSNEQDDHLNEPGWVLI